jgi:hypothetical protein
VKRGRVADRTISPREQIRQLGFHPESLTPAEQVELLALNAELARGEDRRADRHLRDGAPPRVGDSAAPAITDRGTGRREPRSAT